ncbi:25S rRNA (Uridine(2843)-N(3))-methyltransferase [Pleurostoma richardsiae]|uniref:25S rRNA (Uridine(2843)-N(3))-methyltransferase n=1 Tax=Pleurostoma richardsiae TaxID=41990 RepID=A0AA38RSS4_9PEZI|nr:25S rRNA (Uridine(2843)-N(3))-methyltransferase [Pleurostoma richardsiae]
MGKRPPSMKQRVKDRSEVQQPREKKKPAPVSVPEDAQPPTAPEPSTVILPPALQQKILTVFSRAFDPVLSSPSFPTVLQEVKQALFNRDFAAAFGAEVRLEAYAARWSPTRALCYASVLIGLEEALRDIAATDAPSLRVAGKGPHDDEAIRQEPREDVRDEDGSDAPVKEPSELAVQNAKAQDSEKVLKVLAIGGGAAELVAFGALVGHLPNLRGDVTLVDSAPWGAVVDKLETDLSTPLPLSKYAKSEAARAASAAVVAPGRLRTTFLQRDVLTLPAGELAALVGPSPLLVTLLFTLNELFTSGGIRATTSLLLGLTAALPAGSLLLVVDSPGSYSEAAVGRESKRYPMQWLMDKVLLGSTDGAWAKVESDDSVWFRLPDALRYPIPLENMRYQMHLYRAT